jgi:hypothetical protein
MLQQQIVRPLDQQWIKVTSRDATLLLMRVCLPHGVSRAAGGVGFGELSNARG